MENCDHINSISKPLPHTQRYINTHKIYKTAEVKL